MRQILAAAHRRAVRTIPVPAHDRDRGDVPGWVMVTLMTAGLVFAIWTVAEAQLTQLFTSAISKVLGHS